MMKDAIRIYFVVILVAVLAAPLSAQAKVQHARKGQWVHVILKNGRELRGWVGKWVDDVGFYVTPAESAAYLIHPADILTMRDATTGAAVDVPSRSRLSVNSKLLIAAAVTIGTLVILGRRGLLSGPIG